MSPERIRNESYSYPADIWSLGLALFECGTGEFPYTANEGPVNLMLQVCVPMLIYAIFFSFCMIECACFLRRTSLLTIYLHVFFLSLVEKLFI